MFDIRPRQRAVRQQYLSEPGPGGAFKRYRHPWQSISGIRRGDLALDRKTGCIVRVDTLLANKRINARDVVTGKRLGNADPARLRVIERARGLLFNV